MKTPGERFRDVLIWVGALFIISNTIIFLYNINSYWVPAGIGCIFILAVVIYFVMKGFNDR